MFLHLSYMQEHKTFQACVIAHIEVGIQNFQVGTCPSVFKMGPIFWCGRGLGGPSYFQNGDVFSYGTGTQSDNFQPKMSSDMRGTSQTTDPSFNSVSPLRELLLIQTKTVSFHIWRLLFSFNLLLFTQKQWGRIVQILWVIHVHRYMALSSQKKEKGPLE